MTKPKGRLRAIMSSMVAAIVESDAIERHREDPARWYAGRGLDPADAESLATVDPKAWFVYRHLVRGTLRGAIMAELPRTRELLGTRFDDDVDAYLSRSLPGSHYLRDVAFEFLTFAGPRWTLDPGVPPFAEELARYELVAFESAAALPPPGAPPRAAVQPKLDLDSPVVFDESARLVRFSHPVHELEPDIRELERRPTSLLVYRDREYELCTLELEELVADIVEGLLAAKTLKVAIVGACQARAVTMAPELLGTVAEVLADFAERGILLGTAAPSQAVADSPADPRASGPTVKTE